MSDADADAEYEDEDVDGLDEIIAELEGDLDEGMEEDMDEMYEDMAGGSGTDSNAPSMDDEMIGESIDDIINEILDEEMDEGMHEDEDDMEEAMHEMQQGAESVDSKGADLNEALTSLEESYKTINHLRSVINEVNLLNAKLLYTNKLFRSFELSEPQKMKVIENFDRAKTTRETKLVFSTLAESFKKPTKKRVVKESYASRASTSTAPSKKFKENTPILSEGFEQANRWKKLAGLI
jgi:exonuclease VII small subunit